MWKTHICCRVVHSPVYKCVCLCPISLTFRYNQGCVQTHPAQRHMATLVGSSAQEVMDAIEEKGDDEILEWELDELLVWTNTLSFEE